MCEHKSTPVGYFAIVGREFKAKTSRKKVLPIQFSFSRPKNEEVLNSLDTIRRCLQSEGADMDSLFRLENDYKKACETTLSKLLLRSILLDWNNVE